jgi:hypothetical protein
LPTILQKLNSNFINFYKASVLLCHNLQSSINYYRAAMDLQADKKMKRMKLIMFASMRKEMEKSSPTLTRHLFENIY